MSGAGAAGGPGSATPRAATAGDRRIRLVLASANPDKAAEIAAILRQALGDRLELVERPAHVPEVEETGETFAANARLKARALLEATATAAVADDSGLEVDALGGAPGVRSARYAGPTASYEDNVARLLDELAGVEDRRARFRTVAVVAFPDGRELVAEGVCEGLVTRRPRGSRGFGYDPVFLAEGADGRTFGELDEHDKHALSARGKAFRRLAALLADEPGG